MVINPTEVKWDSPKKPLIWLWLIILQIFRSFCHTHPYSESSLSAVFEHYYGFHWWLLQSLECDEHHQKRLASTAHHQCPTVEVVSRYRFLEKNTIISNSWKAPIAISAKNMAVFHSNIPFIHLTKYLDDITQSRSDCSNSLYTSVADGWSTISGEDKIASIWKQALLVARTEKNSIGYRPFPKDLD